MTSTKFYRLTVEEHAALRRALLQLLLEFDRVCRHLGIPYQLGAGTLLGAVRHQGFIPWDDDADVCLLRADYERFAQLAGGVLAPGFFLQHSGTEPASPFLFTKLRLDGTEFVCPHTQALGIHQGIYLDIFPFDDVRPHRICGRLHFELTRLVLMARSFLLSGRNGRVGMKRAPFVRLIFQICNRLLQCFGHERMDRLTTWLVTFYSQRRTTAAPSSAGYVSCLVSGSLRRAQWWQRVRECKAFMYTIPADFCGHHFPIPANYDEVLSNLYGDYRQMPPSEQQCPRHDIVRFRMDDAAYSDGNLSASSVTPRECNQEREVD